MIFTVGLLITFVGYSMAWYGYESLSHPITVLDMLLPSRSSALAAELAWKPGDPPVGSKATSNVKAPKAPLTPSQQARKYAATAPGTPHR